jgi:hypothetical protein
MTSTFLQLLSNLPTACKVTKVPILCFPSISHPSSPIFRKKKKKDTKKGSALAAKQKVSILSKTANLQPMTIPTNIFLGTPKPGLTCPPSGVSSA